MPIRGSSVFSLRFAFTAFTFAASSLFITPTDAQGAYSILDLGTLGGSQSFAYGINAAGQVTGQSLLIGDSFTQAFRTAPGSPLAFNGGLGTLGGNASFGRAINDSGQITGTSDLAGNSVQHAFRTTAAGSLSDGTATDLGTLGSGDQSIGLGINTAGRVTGYSNIVPNGGGATSQYHAFRTTATGLVSDAGADLGTLGGRNSFGYAINAGGQVTGSSWLNGDTIQHAFRTSATGLIGDPGTDLGTFGGTFSEGRAINASGQVTGVANFTGDLVQHAFRTTAAGTIGDGTAADLGTLGGDSSLGLGINTGGQVTGYSRLTGNTVDHAFLYTDGIGMQDLNDLISAADLMHWTLQLGTGINDAGQIAGIGFFNGQSHGFVLTWDPNAVAAATPEPGVYALMGGLGASGIGLAQRRRRRRTN